MSHQTISFIKSGLRIGGYIGLTCVFFSSTETVFYRSAFVATSLLIISELVGIVEEFGCE